MTTLDSQLREVIRAAVEAEPYATAESITRKLLEMHADLIQKWIKEKVTALVTSELKKRKISTPQNSQQLAFPGFENLNRVIPFGSRSVVLQHATIKTLKRSLATMRKSLSNPRVKVLERLIAEMQAVGTPRLTVEKFYELRAAGQLTPAKAKTEKAGAKR